MSDGSAGWRVQVARRQASLDAALHRLVDEVGPDHLLVVVRSAEMEDRVRSLLPFPAQVVRLGDLLGTIAPTPCQTDDLLPEALVHWLTRDGVPAHYKDARDPVAEEYLAAIRLLAANGIRPPYPGRPTHLVERELEAAHAHLLEALRPFNATGSFAPLQRVLLAHEGPTRLAARHPGITTVALFGIDWLSPAEELALETQLQDVVAVEVFAIGRPPRKRGDPLEGPDGPDARWAALAHTDRFVRWAAHWRTEPVIDLDATHEPDARIAHLDRLFSLHPHEQVPLAGAHRISPADPDAEVAETAARIHDLLEADDAVAPESIAVVVPHLEQYAERIRDAFDAHGIPYSLRHSTQLAATAPGGLLALLLSDLDHDHERDRFLDLVDHPLWRWTHTSGDGTTTRLSAPWLRKALARRGLSPRGTDGWRRAFDLMAKVDDMLDAPSVDGAEEGKERTSTKDTPTATDDAPDANRGGSTFLEQQRDVALSLLDRLDAIARTRDPEDFFDRLRRLLQDAAVPRATQRALTHTDDPRTLTRAFDTLLDLLDDTQRAFRLHPQGHDRRAPRDTLARRLHQTPLPLATDRHWGVQVLGFRNAAGLTFRHTWLLGATADALPPPRRPRRLERFLQQRFGVGRLRRLDPELEARRILHGLLADTEGSVWLSAPREVEGAPQAPSVLLQELEDAYRLEGPPSARRAVRTIADLHITALRTQATWPDAPPQLEAARDLLTARTRTAPDGPYSGRLVDDAVRRLVAPRSLSGGEAVSASRLNRYARCPAHALWGDIAGIHDDEEREGDVSPLDKGRVIHCIIDTWSRDLMRRVGVPARVEDADAEEDHLRRVATDVIMGIRLEGLGWEAYKEELLSGLRGTHPYATKPPGLLKRFLDDMVRRDVAVVASEEPFGEEHDAVQIEGDGAQVRIRGTIDRIEERDGELQVLDLKSGNPPHRNETLGGIDLQIPGYVLAAEARYGRAVRHAGYYKIKRPRKDDVRIEVEIPGKDRPEVLDELMAKTPERIRSILRAERAGHHPLTLLDERDAKCSWCDHRFLCGRRPHLTPLRRHAAVADPSTWGYVADHIRDKVGVATVNERPDGSNASDVRDGSDGPSDDTRRSRHRQNGRDGGTA